MTSRTKGKKRKEKGNKNQRVTSTAKKALEYPHSREWLRGNISMTGHPH